MSHIGTNEEPEYKILFVKRLWDTKEIISAFKSILTFFLENKEVNYQIFLESTLSEYENIKSYKENIGKNLHFKEDVSKEEFKLIITIGGDGTILWAHKLLKSKRPPPMICFDGGTLCFLSNFSIRKVDTILEEIHEKIVEDDPFDVFYLPRLKSYVNRKLKLSSNWMTER
jgi:NAD kinase